MTLARCALLLVALAAFVHVGESKVFTVCEFAKTLYSKGIPKSQLPDWVCLAQHESSLNTAATNINTNKSKDSGIFQINDAYWCKWGRQGGDCNIDCKKFLDNNISDDIACAKIIYKRHGFDAWYGWKNHCKGKKLPSVSHCF